MPDRARPGGGCRDRARCRRGCRRPPQRPVGTLHGDPAAIGEDQVIARDQAAERILRILLDPIERGRGIDVPEGHDLPGPAPGQHAPLQIGVEHADPAGLHDDVELAAACQRPVETGLARRPNHHLGPVRVGDVPVGLSVEGIRLEKVIRCPRWASAFSSPR